MNPAHKKIAAYMLLPQIGPRLRTFIGSGFSHIAYFIALVFRAVQLLPDTHPYLLHANFGRFGIRHVVTEASLNLKFKRENMDQVAVFWLIMMGLGILCIQFLLLGLAVLTQAAHATLPSNYAEFFVTQEPTFDIAFVILDRVFGVEGIFGSCVDQGVACYNNTNPDGPYPLHDALHAVFQYYSIGLLVIAVLIFLYFIIAIIAETAQSGTPFGRRFNHVWAPLRMVVALGLLVPLGPGLNSAQYITLYAAKWGSGFATNGWNLFVETAVTGQNTLLGEREHLVAIPNEPPINELAVFFSAVATCVRAEALQRQPAQEIQAFLINPLVDNPTPLQLDGTDFQAAYDYYSQSSTTIYQTADIESSRMMIYFGTQETITTGGESAPEYNSKTQNASHVCGQIAFEITDVDEEGSPGSRLILEQYYELLQDMWDVAREVPSGTNCPAGGGGGGGAAGAMGTMISQVADFATTTNLTRCMGQNHEQPTNQELGEAMEEYQQYLHDAIAEATQAQQNSEEWVQDLQQFGWAGAAIWYNQIATLNGALIGAAHSLPQIVRYPEVMEQIKNERGQLSQLLEGKNRFNPMQPNGEPVEGLSRDDLVIGKALFSSYSIWEAVRTDSSGNFVLDLISSIFGLEGLFNMADNPEIHPMAQLVAIGKGIINNAIRNIGDAFGSFAVASVSKIYDPNIITSAFSALGGFQGMIATIGLGIGFVLFYVVPFFPFIYFFFGVGAWIKTIFEAMVGVPLWALAHIRIDGNGLPGDAAMGGYYLILEIFLRPILVVFGLLAGITIFSAQVRLLHEIWELVVTNVAGADNEAAQDVDAGLTGAIEWLRGPVDQFFYTVIYAIVIYMLALSSFKLIDLIPNHILRWMGSSAETFGDQSGDNAANIMRNSLLGGQMIAQNLGGAAQGVQKSADSAFSGLGGMLGTRSR